MPENFQSSQVVTGLFADNPREIHGRWIFQMHSSDGSTRHDVHHIRFRYAWGTHIYSFYVVL